MPIYEYRCESCGTMKELILKPGEEARPRCGSCRKLMRRVISQTAFILKGEGWYVTDYPSQERKKGMEAEKDSRGAAAKEAAAGKKDSSAPEKPAKKAESKPAAEKKGKSPKS
jgi:putative FmdB family regulatory protein